MRYFQPDFELKHFTEITSEWLKANNIKTILSDLDSTLAIHHQPGGTDVEEWVSMLKETGVELAIISNNSQGRVDRFSEPLGIHGLGRSGKPAIGKIERYMQKMGAKKETSLFLGDQLFTDVWCGKRLKMRTALVHPVGEEHEPWNIRLKRVFERLIRRRW
ncbi:YqeG family HAD IIIA-type phosphatase [Alkalihalobacterium elongatum]|uniref:YqeG family HAD IIIA-type phosphatase n=1 Tax=Alkalihalobacterium elongatum TaxID=2675466 RepID=UPI001C1FBEA3|nr:YqeG family HAD IIIA-type phosphatase [Alkalihalobacterium elongatum]